LAEDVKIQIKIFILNEKIKERKNLYINDKLKIEEG